MIDLGIILLSLCVGFWWWWFPKLKPGNFKPAPDQSEIDQIRMLKKQLQAEISSNQRLAELSIKRRDEINTLQQKITPGLYANGGLTADESHALYDHDRYSPSIGRASR